MQTELAADIAYILSGTFVWVCIYIAQALGEERQSGSSGYAVTRAKVGESIFN